MRYMQQMEQILGYPNWNALMETYVRKKWKIQETFEESSDSLLNKLFGVWDQDHYGWNALYICVIYSQFSLVIWQSGPTV